MNSNSYLQSKPRYEILDGLRGVAALIVVAFHLFETYSEGTQYQVLNHGYLAVDFFFILSGFVIGYAYDDRWHKMSVLDFAKRRLVRLHPMLIMGTLIGAVWFYFTDAPGFEPVSQTPIWLFAVCTIMGCLMLPTPPQIDIRGWGEVNSLNGAVWSLLWEYVANIMYMLFIRRFSTLMLALFVGASALLTINYGLNLQCFGAITVGDEATAIDANATYTFIGGFGLTAHEIFVAFTRLLYPFFAGLLMSRLMRKQPSESSYGHGFMVCSVLIVAILCAPYIGGPEFNWRNGLYDTLAILLAFPAIVLLGARSKVDSAHGKAVCKFLGDISYPLYVTHYPLIYLQMKWAATHQHVPASQHVAVAVLLFVFAVGVAYASLKVYDEPVREWLKNKVKWSR